MIDRCRQVATHACAAGIIMSLFGWFFAATGISDSRFYNAMVDVFYWMLRIGGALLLVTGALCFARQKAGLLIDAAVTGLCGVIMLLYSVSGVTAGLGMSLNHMVVLVLGAMFLGSARNSWNHYRMESAEGASLCVAPDAMSDYEAVHPASIHPPSLPDEQEPPPPDGYLAALSKEEDEPPSASYQ